MFSRRDRKELGVLGLLVLAWGLLIAPLLHALTPAHGHSHGALPQQGEQHGAGSVEHLLAVATSAPVTAELSWVRTPMSVAQMERPWSPDLEVWNTVEEPQGP